MATIASHEEVRLCARRRLYSPLETLPLDILNHHILAHLEAEEKLELSQTCKRLNTSVWASVTECMFRIQGFIAVSRKLVNCVVYNPIYTSTSSVVEFTDDALDMALKDSSTPLLPKLTTMDIGELDWEDIFPQYTALTDPLYEKTPPPPGSLTVPKFKQFFLSLTSLSELCCTASVAASLPAMTRLKKLDLCHLDLLPTQSLSELSGCHSLESLTTSSNSVLPRDEKYILKHRIDIRRMPKLIRVDWCLVNPRFKPDAHKNYIKKLCEVLREHPLIKESGFSHADCVPSMPIRWTEFLDSYVAAIASEPDRSIQSILTEAIIQDSRTSDMNGRISFLYAVAKYGTDAAIAKTMALPSYDPTLLFLKPRDEFKSPLASLSHCQEAMSKFVGTITQDSVTRALSDPRFDDTILEELIEIADVELMSRLLELGLPAKLPFNESLLDRVLRVCRSTYLEERASKLRQFARELIATNTLPDSQSDILAYTLLDSRTFKWFIDTKTIDPTEADLFEALCKTPASGTALRRCMSYLTADYVDKFAEERKKTGAEPMVIRLVKRGAYDAVDGVCAFSKEVNGQDKEGWTALHWMIQQIGDKSVKIDDAFKSAFDAVRKLADHTIQNKAGHTPLDIAFVGPDPTSHLKRLLPLHSKVGSAFLRRALFAAIENNDINLLHGLVVGSADFFNPALSYDRRVFPHVSPDVLNDEGESALSVAIRVGNINVIDLLLQHGACPKSHGKPLPFHTACEIHEPSTFVEVLAALCTRGADLRIRNRAKESCLTIYLRSLVEHSQSADFEKKWVAPRQLVESHIGALKAFNAHRPYGKYDPTGDLKLACSLADEQLGWLVLKQIYQPSTCLDDKEFLEKTKPSYIALLKALAQFS